MGPCIMPSPVRIVQSQNVVIGSGYSTHETTNPIANNDHPKFTIVKHSPNLSNANSQQKDPSSAPPPLIRRKNQERQTKNSKDPEPINYGSHNILKFKAVCQKCMQSHLDRFLDNCYQKQLCVCNGYGVMEYDVGIKRKCQKCLAQTTISLENCKRCLGRGYIPN